VPSKKSLNSRVMLCFVLHVGPRTSVIAKNGACGYIFSLDNWSVKLNKRFYVLN
jgi:hypothetical protein